MQVKLTAGFVAIAGVKIESSKGLGEMIARQHSFHRPTAYKAQATKREVIQAKGTAERVQP